MADNKLQLPSGQGGLVRYFEDYKSKIEIDPKVVMGFILFIVILEILLKAYY